MCRVRPGVPRGCAPALGYWGGFSILAQVWYDGHEGSSHCIHSLVRSPSCSISYPCRVGRSESTFLWVAVTNLALKHTSIIREWVPSLSSACPALPKGHQRPRHLPLGGTIQGCLGSGWLTTAGGARGPPNQKDWVAPPLELPGGNLQVPGERGEAAINDRDVDPRWEEAWRYGEPAQWPTIPPQTTMDVSKLLSMLMAWLGIGTPTYIPSVVRPLLERPRYLLSSGTMRSGAPRTTTWKWQFSKVLSSCGRGLQQIWLGIWGHH